LSIADNADMSTGDIDYTFGGWLYLDTKTAVMAAVSKWETDGFEYILFYDSSADRLTWIVGNGAGSPIATVVASNFGNVPTATWIHFVAWHDAGGNLAGIRINDTSENTAVTSGTGGEGAEGFKLGANAATPANFWNGRIDAVGFWKRLLTAGEKTELFNSGSGVEHPF
jgi:hypothetical protein